jgi:superfamily II DNA or RNA helicase
MSAIDYSKFPDPYPFQVSAREKLRAGFVAGHRCQMVMSPTGSGKTILAMFLTRESLARGKRVVFVADRRTLIQQTSDTADSVGLSDHGVLMANHWRFNPESQFQIASAQTIASRVERGQGWPEADLIIVDEAHTQLDVWTQHIRTCRAAVIGLSATPFSAGLGQLFSNLINAATMRELTERGDLVPMRVMSCTKVNMNGAATSGGEWTIEAAGERGMEIIGNVVHEWTQHAENRKTIVFGSTIDHCEALVREFNEAGVMAVAFTSKTLEAERKEILEDFKSADSIVRVLVSVEALAKGFDQRDVSCVCDVRPLRKSLSTAIQMWGRGLRVSPATGKTDMLLLDFSGNIVRFAEDFEKIYANGLDSLDTGEKLDKIVRKDVDDDEQDGPVNCPQCQFKPFRKRCMSCGFEAIKPVLVEHEAGQMVEFKVGKVSVGNKLTVWEQVVSYCRGQGKPESAKARAMHLYRAITGQEPRGLPMFDATPTVAVSREIAGKAVSERLRFLKSKAKA